MNNLLKMDKYLLVHNRVYWGGIITSFLVGFLTAETYVAEVMGPDGGQAASLTDIFNGMVYDSTFLLIFIAGILALILGKEFSWRTINQEVCAGHPRNQIFSSKVIVYLVAFNLMALVYPIAGCLRECMRFGLADAGIFFRNLGKVAGYSLLLNSAVFLFAILFCCFFRSMAKAVSVTVIVLFVLSLYLGYGMKLKFPVSFLPIFQIREVVTSQNIVVPGSLGVAIIWWFILIFLSWRVFCKCELK